MKFIDADGGSRFGRFRIRTDAGTEYLTPEAAAAQSPNFLFDDILSRVAKETGEIGRAVAALLETGDVVDDATIQCSDSRLEVDFGTIVLKQEVKNDQAEQQRIIFDPIPRVDGIGAVCRFRRRDVRADAYLFSWASAPCRPRSKLVSN